MNAEKLVKLSEKDLLCVVGGSASRSSTVIVAEPTCKLGELSCSSSDEAEPDPQGFEGFLRGVKEGFLQEGPIDTIRMMYDGDTDSVMWGLLVAELIGAFTIFGAGYALAKRDKIARWFKKKFKK